MLYLRLVVGFTCFVIASLFLTKFFHQICIIGTCKLAYNFFGDVAANVLPVVRNILFLFLFNFAEDMKAVLGEAVIFVSADIEDELSFFMLSLVGDELAQKRIIRFGSLHT